MERTWEDLQRRALTDVFLHRCLHWERQVGRERALINTCLALAEDRQRLQDRVTRLFAEALTPEESERIRRTYFDITTTVISTEP